MALGLIASTVVWIMSIGGASFLFRKKISNLIKKIPLPNFLLFLIIGTLYSVIEENINCPPTGCTLIPFTIPIFFAFLVIYLILLKMLSIKNFYLGILIFGLMGWAAEFIFGSYRETLWSSPIVTILMSIWTILTYSIIVILPVTILLENKKQRSPA